MIWLIAGILAAVWLVCVILNKGGFVHILLLCAVAIFVVQWVASRRAT